MVRAQIKFHILVTFYVIFAAWSLVSHGKPIKQADEVQNENITPSEVTSNAHDVQEDAQKKSVSKKHIECSTKTRRTVVTSTKEAVKNSPKGLAGSCTTPEKRECHHWECHKECPDGSKEDCCGCDECEHHECHGKDGDCCEECCEHHECHNCDHHGGDCDGCHDCDCCHHDCDGCHDCDHCCGDCDCCHGCHDCDCCHGCHDCDCCHHDCDGCHDCDHCCGDCDHCCCDRRSACSGGHTKQVKISVAASVAKEADGTEKPYKRCCCCLGYFRHGCWGHRHHYHHHRCHCHHCHHYPCCFQHCPHYHCPHYHSSDSNYAIPTTGDDCEHGCHGHAGSHDYSPHDCGCHECPLPDCWCPHCESDVHVQSNPPVCHQGCQGTDVNSCDSCHEGQLQVDSPCGCGCHDVHQGCDCCHEDQIHVDTPLPEVNQRCCATISPQCAGK